MGEKKNTLTVIDGETLMDTRLEQTKFCIGTLLPQGITILGGADASYGNDYDEIRQMKQLADELNIFLLLVHHLRKQGDSDPLNKLSGTTGIIGAIDSVFVIGDILRPSRLKRNTGKM